jgi:hypothetical protein
MVVFTLVNKVGELVETLREQYGEFKLAMLYNRSLESSKGWNLIVSAPWLDEMGRAESIKMIAHQLREKLGQQEMSAISRITVLKPSDPFVQSVTSFYPVGIPIPQLTADEISGSGFILSSQKAA